MEVLVFKTNIDSPAIKPVVAQSLTQIKGVTSWSIDFGDRDKVLRIEAENVGPAEIVRSIASAGYQCEELV
jgi:copper chaperone CopZ